MHTRSPALYDLSAVGPQRRPTLRPLYYGLRRFIWSEPGDFRDPITKTGEFFDGLPYDGHPTDASIRRIECMRFECEKEKKRAKELID